MIQPISELAGCRKAIVAGYSKGNHVYLYRRVSEGGRPVDGLNDS